MRRSAFDCDWLTSEEGALMGIALGYDRCGEHEMGTGPLLRALGVNLPEYPVGVESRTIAAVTNRLVLVEYQLKPRDRRRKAYPAAFLMLEPPHWDHRETRPDGKDKLAHADVAFHTESTDKYWKPAYDLAAAWDHETFCIHVRGAENIARLKELHQAFLSKDIAVALPWSHAFHRGGLAFAMPSKMDAAWKQHVLERDLHHRDLCEAAKATGIHDVLAAAGKKWFALSPDYFDRQSKDEVIFFLNPQDQCRYHHGWFTVQELREWAQDKGPVLKHACLETFAKRPENADWASRLLKGLNEKGLNTRYHTKLVWFDEAQTVPGLLVRMAVDSLGAMADGVYRFEDLMQQYAVGDLVEEKSAAA